MKLLIFVLWSLIIPLFVSMPAFGALVSSSFDTNRDGWFIQELNQTTLAEEPSILPDPTWSGTGGNPGGHVSFGDPSLPEFVFFASNNSFLIDQSSNLGGTLRFDLLNSIGNQNPADLVVLQGGPQGSGVILRYLGDQPVTTSYTTFTVPLEATSAWQAFENGANRPATPADFTTVLSELTALLIRGDWDAGLNTSRLDNVILAPVPIPSAIMLMSTGLLGLIASARTRRALLRPS